MNVPGFTPESIGVVEGMLAYAFSSPEKLDWQKNFKTGKSPAPEKPGDYHTGLKDAKDITQGVQKSKQTEPEMISGPTLPKGPGNPQAGSSKNVQGMRAFAEGQENPYLGQCDQKKKREADKQQRTPAQEKADQARAQAARDNIDPQTRSEAAKKGAETRAKCKGLR